MCLSVSGYVYFWGHHTCLFSEQTLSVLIMHGIWSGFFLGGGSNSYARWYKYFQRFLPWTVSVKTSRPVYLVSLMRAKPGLAYRLCCVTPASGRPRRFVSCTHQSIIRPRIGWVAITWLSTSNIASNNYVPSFFHRLVGSLQFKHADRNVFAAVSFSAII